MVYDNGNCKLKTKELEQFICVCRKYRVVVNFCSINFIINTNRISAGIHNYTSHEIKTLNM